MIPKMLCRLFALLLVGVGCGLAQVTVPDTPAGHTLQAWLAAFNSGDRARIETYVKTVDQSQSVDGMISFRNQTGGFELLSMHANALLLAASEEVPAIVMVGLRLAFLVLLVIEIVWHCFLLIDPQREVRLRQHSASQGASVRIILHDTSASPHFELFTKLQTANPKNS